MLGHFPRLFFRKPPLFIFDYVLFGDDTAHVAYGSSCLLTQNVLQQAGDFPVIRLCASDATIKSQQCIACRYDGVYRL